MSLKRNLNNSLNGNDMKDLQNKKLRCQDETCDEISNALHSFQNYGSTSKDMVARCSLRKYYGFHSCRKGERDEMQDAHVILDDYLFSAPDITSEVKSLSYYAIFDGHGGVRAAKFAAEHLHKNLSAKLPKKYELALLEKQLKRCFVEVYKQTDDEFLQEATKSKPVLKDGSTATVLLIINETLYVTNLGDSKAILCRFKPDEKKEIALTLTRDHNPTVFEERMRIERAGGHVKDGRVMGILEVSRSIGDGQYKAYGVSCVPDVKRCPLTENDRYIIIGCDGLWKVFSNSEVLDFVALTLKDTTIVATEEKSMWQRRCEEVCDRLSADAVRRGSGDNVTVLFVVLKEFEYIV